MVESRTLIGLRATLVAVRVVSDCERVGVSSVVPGSLQPQAKGVTLQAAGSTVAQMILFQTEGVFWYSK